MSPSQSAPDPMRANPAIEVPILAKYAPCCFAQIEDVSWG